MIRVASPQTLNGRGRPRENTVRRRTPCDQELSGPARAGPVLRHGQSIIPRHDGGKSSRSLMSTPGPGPGEAFIDVSAAGVNPVDLKLYSGAFGTAQASFLCIWGCRCRVWSQPWGTDAAGISGPLSVGDEVIASRISGGAVRSKCRRRRRIRCCAVLYGSGLADRVRSLAPEGIDASHRHRGHGRSDIGRTRVRLGSKPDREDRRLRPAKLTGPGSDSSVTGPGLYSHTGGLDASDTEQHLDQLPGENTARSDHPRGRSSAHDDHVVADSEDAEGSRHPPARTGRQLSSEASDAAGGEDDAAVGHLDD